MGDKIKMKLLFENWREYRLQEAEETETEEETSEETEEETFEETTNENTQKEDEE